MATINFSVPEEIRDEFNHCFAGANKSALLTRFIREAIQHHHYQQRLQNYCEATSEWQLHAPVLERVFTGKSGSNEKI